MATTKIGASGSLNSAITKQWDKQGLEILKKNHVFVQLCDHRTQPAGTGTTFNTYYWTRLNGGSAVTAEGTVPTAQAITATSVEITVNQYIKSVEFTDLAIDQFRADLIGSGRDQVFYQMADTTCRS